MRTRKKGMNSRIIITTDNNQTIKNLIDYLLTSDVASNN